jgi:hypothetical protein
MQGWFMEDKPLASGATTSFIKKCSTGHAGGKASAACAVKAVSKTGKRLTGAAKTSFMKKCEAAA